MKYHYQYVSKSSVRIELIPEDKKEKAILDRPSSEPENSEELINLFQLALEHYKPGSVITKCNFMNFPMVALCSYRENAVKVDQVA